MFPNKNATLISQTRDTPNLIEKCSREEIVDGRGNKIEAGPMIIYEIERDRIMDSRENDMCLSRDYGPLQPVKR